MRLWLVRPGRNGEYEARAFEEGLLTIGFGLEEDVSAAKDRDALLAVMKRLFPEATPSKRRNFAAQVNQFVNVARDGDLVVSPVKTSSTVAVGRLTGAYRPDEGMRPTRPIEWLRTDIPRDAFRQDLLYSLGAFMTVCEISWNDALERMRRVAAGGVDPGDGTAPAMPAARGQSRAPEATEASDGPVDLERIARDQIERRIASTFVGHDFTRLVAAILAAQGYRVRVSPPGADRGVDIVAGSGPLGLESPRVTVQVKSGDVRVEQSDLQGLIGAVQDTQADHGLIVSWGGYTGAVRARLNELYFRVRLWGREELVDNLLRVYDALPEDIRAELPLRRTWTLVMEAEEETV